MGDWAVVVEGLDSDLAARTFRSTCAGGTGDEPLEGQGQPQGHLRG